jgi:hypothetical protein
VEVVGALEEEIEVEGVEDLETVAVVDLETVVVADSETVVVDEVAASEEDLAETVVDEEDSVIGEVAEVVASEEDSAEIVGAEALETAEVEVVLEIEVAGVASVEVVVVDLLLLQAKLEPSIAVPLS